MGVTRETLTGEEVLVLFQIMSTSETLLEENGKKGKLKAVHFSSPNSRKLKSNTTLAQACEEGPSVCSHLLTFCSLLLIIITLPLSLLYTVKVVQEYERAVIFRLGRLLSGGARGP